MFTSDFPYVGHRFTPRVKDSPHDGAGVLRSFGVTPSVFEESGVLS